MELLLTRGADVNTEDDVSKINVVTIISFNDG